MPKIKCSHFRRDSERVTIVAPLLRTWLTHFLALPHSHSRRQTHTPHLPSSFLPEMARIDVGAAERPLAARKQGGEDWSTADDDEKRAAVPVDDGECGGDDQRAADGEWRLQLCCVVLIARLTHRVAFADDKSVAVLSRHELLSFDDDDNGDDRALCRERLVLAIQNMREQEDWLVQHEVRAGGAHSCIRSFGSILSVWLCTLIGYCDAAPDRRAPHEHSRSAAR